MLFSSILQVCHKLTSLHGGSKLNIVIYVFSLRRGGGSSFCGSGGSSSKPIKLPSVNLASIVSSSISVNLLFLIMSLLKLANFFAKKYILLKGLFPLQILSVSTVLLDAVGLIMEARNAS